MSYVGKMLTLLKLDRFEMYSASHMTTLAYTGTGQELTWASSNEINQLLVGFRTVIIK